MKKIFFVVLFSLISNISHAQNPWNSCQDGKAPCATSCEVTDADHPYTAGRWVQECKINGRFVKSYGSNCRPGEDEGTTFICRSITSSGPTLRR
ncbi:MAG: hypothetical protein IPK04_14230 [Bdellovibrionales bacterium]|jgi:hypothetical protein|nr:hypothetical protein [Bdellovibrionales bacterium]